MEEAQADNGYEFDVRGYLRVLWRRKGVVAASVALLLLIGIGLSLLERPTYAASATVLIPTNSKAAVDPTGTQPFTSSDLLNRALQNEILFAQGDAVASEVRKTLGRLPSVTITPSGTADALTFAAEDSGANRAAEDANAYARAYLHQRRTTQASDYLATASILQTQIDHLHSQQNRLSRNDPSQAGISATIGTLQASLATLNASGQLSRAGGSVISRATAPSSPASPNIARNAFIAAFLGLMLGVWAAFVIDRLDDSIRSTEDLESVTRGFPTLALIPWAEDWPKKSNAFLVSVEQPESACAEAYRTLRTTVRLLRSDDELRVILTTSATAGEGKTTTVVNLAVALARTGEQVVLIDADLRRPLVHEFFGLGNDIGLTSVMMGDSSLHDALQTPTGHPTLRVLTSGPQVPNPSEILSSPAIQAVISELRDRGHELVVVDAPPVLPVPDAMQLSAVSDGVLMIVGSNTVKKRQLSRAMQQLRQIDAPLFGIVLNGVRRANETNYDIYKYGTYSNRASTTPPSPLVDGSQATETDPPAGTGPNTASTATTFLSLDDSRTTATETPSPTSPDQAPAVPRSRSLDDSRTIATKTRSGTSRNGASGAAPSSSLDGSRTGATDLQSQTAESQLDQLLRAARYPAGENNQEAGVPVGEVEAGTPVWKRVRVAARRLRGTSTGEGTHNRG